MLAVCFLTTSFLHLKQCFGRKYGGTGNNKAVGFEEITVSQVSCTETTS